MTGNIIAAAVLLAAGVVVLRHLRRDKANRQHGLPLVAFVAGPVFAAFYIWMDYKWIQPYNYRTIADATESGIPVMVVGAICGAVGAFAIWVGNRVTWRRVR